MTDAGSPSRSTAPATRETRAAPGARATRDAGTEHSSATRTERDTMGEVEVVADRYWGAQTERSLQHFDIGRDTFVWGRPVVRGLGLLTKCAALANAGLGLLDDETARAVTEAADEVARGELDEHFPLVV
ncbi:MAG: lyase family protein, partial [Phycicoccus sp.]